MKFNKLLLLYLLCPILCFCQKGDSGQKDDPKVLVSGVTLNTTAKDLNVSETFNLSATVIPEDASNKKVTWSSSDSATVTVEGGTVTGIKDGFATITVRTEDGGKTADCQVTVSDKFIHVSEISLTNSSAVLGVGENTTLTATVLPKNATNKNVAWKSSDESIAVVNNGVVTGIKRGSATITVTTDDGGKTATCQILVLSEPSGSNDNYDIEKYEW